MFVCTGNEVILFLILTLSFDFFLFMPYDNLGISRKLKFVIILFLILGCIWKRRDGEQEQIEYERRELYFRKEMLLLIILPFFSGISSYIYRGQPLLTSWIAGRNSLYFLLYFYLHKARVSQYELLRVVVTIATISSLIYILQQITYPDIYLFNSTQNADDVEIRNGFYRFRLFGLNPYIFLAFFYTLSVFINAQGNKSHYVTMLVLFTAGIFLTLTRQIYVCIFLPVIFYSLFDGDHVDFRKILALLFGFIVLYVIFLNLDTILGADMIERTLSEGEDNIRYMSYYYFGVEYWKDFLNMIFGNGVASWGNSAYGDEILLLEETDRLYRSDIGVVGTFNIYGIAYLLAIGIMYRKIFKYFRYIPTYLKLLIVASLINLPLSCWFDPDMGLYMAIIVYLMDISINEAMACDDIEGDSNMVPAELSEQELVKTN